MREYMEVPLQLHKLKLECLQKKIVLMPAGTTEYEKNEVILEKIKTGAEIKALHQIIAEREAYYINYWNKEFLPSIEDMENNLSHVINTARARAKDNPEIKEQLARVEFQPVGSVNIEGKLMNYKILKNLLKQ